MGKNCIFNSDIRHHYLANEACEKVTYLQIPEKVSIKSLERDIKNGAVQFRDIYNLLEKKTPSNYILLQADTLEMGYMAIMYHAACYNAKEGIADSYDAEENECEAQGIEFEAFNIAAPNENSDEGYERWEESVWKVPVVNVYEIKRSLCDSNEPYIFNNMPMQWNRQEVNQRPYWMDCKQGSICITMEQQPYGGAGIDERLIEALDYFKDNRFVYILFPGIERDCPEDDCGSEFSWNQLFCVANDAIKNLIILNLLADEAKVSLEQNERQKYYRYLLKEQFRKREISVVRGFSYVRVVNMILSMPSEDKCNMMEKVIRYALKDKEETGCILSNADFKFIDRFQRTGVPLKKKVKSAKRSLQEDLVGMEAVKEQVVDIVNVMKYNEIRRKMKIGGSDYHNVHIMLGAPGTAKTTVAKLMGQMMVEEKLLPDNRFICVNGAELKGMYVGHSAPKTKALFENYDIIVIDEAYSLVDDSGETDSFSKEAIAQLIIELENHSTDKLIIFAGYGGAKVSRRNDKMRKFIDANPGIKSRITSTFYFDSYSADEMVQIFHRLAGIKHYTIDDSVDELLYQFFQVRVKDENFGNGREGRSLLETTILFAAKRVMASSKKAYTQKEMRILLAEDVRHAIEKMNAAENVQSTSNRQRIGF